MRKIIEYTLVSVDGVFAGTDISEFMGYRDDAYIRDGLGLLMACDAMLMGRRTYETFAKIWPGRVHPWADRLNGIKKYVFSSKLETAE
ncbi:MAG TPA: dihydrofolate reductase family protein, partial [Mucilaginibacter sp.]